MRKASPNDIVDDFVGSVSTALIDWQVVDTAAKANSLSLRVRRRVASDSFLALTVAWERFLSRWLVAAVNKDASRAAARLTEKLKSHAHVELKVPSSHISSPLIATSHFSLASVRGVLGAQDDNIVLRSHKDLQKFADEWLGPALSGSLKTVSSYHFNWVLAMRLIRNALVHQSDKSLRQVNDSLRTSSMPPEIRVVGTRNLSANGCGAYLYKRIAAHTSSQLPMVGRQPRLVLFHFKLSSIAGQLKVP